MGGRNLVCCTTITLEVIESIFFDHKNSSVCNRPYMVKSKWHILVIVGVYVQEPLVGGKQTTRLLNHRFIVVYRVNEEQRVLLKLLVENLNDLLSSPDVGLVASVWKAANTIDVI
jgi:hypothetical protein